MTTYFALVESVFWPAFVVAIISGIVTVVATVDLGAARVEKARDTARNNMSEASAAMARERYAERLLRIAVIALAVSFVLISLPRRGHFQPTPPRATKGEAK